MTCFFKMFMITFVGSKNHNGVEFLPDMMYGAFFVPYNTIYGNSALPWLICNGKPGPVVSFDKREVGCRSFISPQVKITTK